jgi:glycosyltransferase involved in cell wall biosynthesis
VQVVPNGVDVARFDRASVDGARVRRQLGIPLTAPVVGTVAVFRQQKRLDDWLEAAHEVRRSQADTHFVLVGDGPEREHLHARARELQLDGVVHFTGAHTDVRPFLAAMDVFLISSAFEGLPVALLEAMSMQCGIVATSIGGIPEVVRHGTNGLLVPAKQPALLAAAVLQMIKSSDLRAACGDAARHTVTQSFSLQAMIQQLESTYVEVVKEQRNGH